MPEPQVAAEAAELLASISDDIEPLLVYVWRRHLTNAIARMLADADPAVHSDPSAPIRVVGFADLVSFTSFVRRMSERQLARLVQRFELLASDVITEHGGRVIKTVGDEVLFVHTEAAAASAIALDLVDAMAEDELLPPVRVGLAHGRVVSRLGDVFGMTVNKASRITAVTPSGHVYVDDDMARVLGSVSGFSAIERRRRILRGIGVVTLHELQRAPGGRRPPPIRTRRRDYDRPMTKVLLAEDDPAISDPLARALRREGYDVDVCTDGVSALEEALRSPDLLVLDLGLPKMDGLEVCRRLRQEGSTVPVLVLTARADEVDTVVGLDAGADDYVTKPFRLAELLARARALLRRGVVELPAPEALVRIDPEGRRVFLHGQEVQLTGKEFELLKVLVANEGKVVSREKLMRDVWDSAWYGSTKTLDMHISVLRRKLGDDASHPSYITTIRGVGFRFDAPED